MRKVPVSDPDNLKQMSLDISVLGRVDNFAVTIFRTEGSYEREQAKLF